MTLYNEATLYEILDIHNTASSQEVRYGYLKSKSVFQKDSLATYTLISREEREQALAKIEEAYLVLTDPKLRHEYDHRCKFLEEEDFFTPPQPETQLGPSGPLSHPFALASNPASAEPRSQSSSALTVQDPFSIGDFSLASCQPLSEAFLIAPSTDANHFPAIAPPPSVSLNDSDSSSSTTTYPATTRPPQHPTSLSAYASPYSDEGDQAFARNSKNFSEPFPTQTATATTDNDDSPFASAAASSPVLPPAFDASLPWTGNQLKLSRIAAKLSVEELNATTKIPKHYILALENEHFSKLPARVYVRGFVIQIAKTLRLPQERVVLEYLSRYNPA